MSKLFLTLIQVRRFLARIGGPSIRMTAMVAAPLAPLLFGTPDAAAQQGAAQKPILVNMNRFTPHQTRVDVFTITSPQTVQIDAVGADERFPRSGKLNFLEKAFGQFQTRNEDDAWRGNAWIIDAKNRNVVWELRTARTGHESNGVRDFSGTVHLQPGTYEAYYASYSAFNTVINISTNENTTPEQIRAHTKYDDDGISKKFAFTVRGIGRPLPVSTYLSNVDAFRRGAVLSLTGLKAGQTRAQGFTLDRPTRVSIYAIGEVRESETFDYGWIINADTHEKVWGLQFSNSAHAGGSPKNRMARATVMLPAGRYAAIYTLDDSHDISDWNSAPPHDPGLWGMTINVNASDRAGVRTFAYDPKPKHAIVALTGVGSSELKSAGFTLTKPARVRVFALGEGTPGSMSDYGWITDAKTRKRVWSMDYGNTQFAGGGSKNRLASQVLALDAGSYIVNYRTDDSHAAGDWNEGAPIEGDMWGITVMPVNAADRAFVTAYDPDAAEGDVIARLTNMEDDEDARATFRLDKPTDVHVYAIGEGRDGEMFDRGYIEERGTRRVVWEMTFRTTTHAGGAPKNRVFDGVVKLPAGDYVLRWESDDSHSAADWNMAPPEDPSHWGITLYRAGK